jgi:ketosteroid isomerase-like protein
MKKLIILIVGVLFLTTNSSAQNKEEEAIKKVCIAETKAYNDFDLDALAAYHVQGVNDQLVANLPDGSFNAKSGWENISKALKDYFQSSKKESVTLSSNDFTFVIQGKMAFVCYTASAQNAAGKTTITREYRNLLKIKGQWKILAEQVYADYTSGK